MARGTTGRETTTITTARVTTEKEARRGMVIILAVESTGMERATKVSVFLRNCEACVTVRLSFPGDHNKGGDKGKDHG
jgi:hypothetical protein